MVTIDFNYLYITCILVRVNRRCTWIMDSRGTVQSFTSRDQEHIVSNVIEPMACDGLRTICVAYKDYVTGKSLTNTPVFTFPPCSV